MGRSYKMETFLSSHWWNALAHEFCRVCWEADEKQWTSNSDENSFCRSRQDASRKEIPNECQSAKNCCN